MSCRRSFHIPIFATEMAAFQGKPLVTIVLKKPLVLYPVVCLVFKGPFLVCGFMIPVAISTLEMDDLCIV